MARDTAAAPVEMKESPGGIRWRRWLGLSIPSVIGLVLLVAGIFADALATHDPDFIDLLARLQPPRLRRRHLDAPAGHRRTGARHLQPAAARRARLADRRGDRRAGGGPDRQSHRHGVGLGGRLHRAGANAHRRCPVGAAVDPLRRPHGQRLRAQPCATSSSSCWSGPGPPMRGWSAPTCCRSGSATSSRRPAPPGRRAGGSCASTCSPTWPTPSSSS